MCFIWQSWGDNTDIAQAALGYTVFLFATFVYCQFGEELSQQVIIIWLLQTDFSDCIPWGVLLMEITWMTLVFVFAGFTVMINT